MYWRQMGHSLSTFPHAVHVAMWPHSSITHSIGASMQILHKSSEVSISIDRMDLSSRQRRSTRSRSSAFSQQPLKSTRFSIRISLSCFTESTSRSALSLMSVSLICFIFISCRLPEEYKFVQIVSSCAGAGGTVLVLRCAGRVLVAPSSPDGAKRAVASFASSLTLASSVMESVSVKSNDPLLRRSR
uniref:Uncharacterized protein n=1 Tax=Anopheles braziliensis TaxID=58242 RepID=A0A2M3ZL15_9DIPT